MIYEKDSADMGIKNVWQFIIDFVLWLEFIVIHFSLKNFLNNYLYYQIINNWQLIKELTVIIYK
jgi:hypothetical protein